jgi:hypothetical protein
MKIEALVSLWCDNGPDPARARDGDRDQRHDRRKIVAAAKPSQRCGNRCSRATENKSALATSTTGTGRTRQREGVDFHHRKWISSRETEVQGHHEENII